MSPASPLDAAFSNLYTLHCTAPSPSKIAPYCRGDPDPHQIHNFLGPPAITPNSLLTKYAIFSQCMVMVSPFLTIDKPNSNPNDPSDRNPMNAKLTVSYCQKSEPMLVTN